MKTSVSRTFKAARRFRHSGLVMRALPIVFAAFTLNCGDVYRPVAIPIPGPSPTPAPTHFVYSVSSNGPTNPGSMSRIDVAGDSTLSSLSIGVAPVHAALTPDGTRFFVANSGEDTVSESPNAFNTQGGTIDLISLCDAGGCPAVMPIFVATTENSRAYVAGFGNGTVSFIDTTSNAVSRTVAVNPAFSANPPTQPLPLPDRNAKPVALVELPNGSKIYSVNQGNKTVTSINTVDGSIAQVIPFANAPIWAVSSSDGAHLFVLDNAGGVTTIDTVSDTALASLAVATAGTNNNSLFYDRVFNRLFVTDANANPPAAHVFDVIGTSASLAPHGPGVVPISIAPGSSCTSAPVPTSITVIGDGSRAYVASYQNDPGVVCTQATVIDTASGTMSKAVPLTTTPDNSGQTGCNLARFRVYAVSSGGSSNSNFKVFVSQCDAGTTAVIYTNAVSSGADPHPADVMMATVASPVSSFAASQVSISGVSASAVTCPTATSVTYTYSLLSGPALQQGMTVYVSGMNQLANNGAFVITAATPSTFTVVNTCPMPDTSAQAGSGSVIPPQNPLFLVPGP